MLPIIDLSTHSVKNTLLQYNKPLLPFGYILAAVFGHNDHILNSYPELVFNINPGLYSHYHSLFHHRFADGIAGGIFVNFNTYAVTESVTEAVAVARFIDNIPRGTVNLFTYNSLQDRGRFETTEKG